MVCAWGPPTKVPPRLRARFGEVVAILRMHEVPLHVLALTKDPPEAGVLLRLRAADVSTVALDVGTLGAGRWRRAV